MVHGSPHPGLHRLRRGTESENWSWIAQRQIYRIGSWSLQKVTASVAYHPVQTFMPQLLFPMCVSSSSVTVYLDKLFSRFTSAAR
jgi:hypothetical protein